MNWQVSEVERYDYVSGREVKNTFGYRLKVLCALTDSTQAELALALRIEPASLSRYINGRAEPTLETLQRVALHFPALNFEWLLIGEGPVWKSELVPPDAQAMQEQVNYLMRENHHLKDMVALLESNLKYFSNLTIKHWDDKNNKKAR